VTGIGIDVLETVDGPSTIKEMAKDLQCPMTLCPRDPARPVLYTRSRPEVQGSVFGVGVRVGPDRPGTGDIISEDPTGTKRSTSKQTLGRPLSNRQRTLSYMKEFDTAKKNPRLVASPVGFVEKGGGGNRDRTDRKVMVGILWTIGPRTLDALASMLGNPRRPSNGHLTLGAGGTAVGT